MPLSWVRAKFEGFRSQVLGELANELEIEVSDDLLEALAAATALVAFADGVSSPDEREELLSVFEDEDRLTEIDLDDLFDAFDDYAEQFTDDRNAAETEALGAVGVFDDAPDQARLLVRAALAIASTDGVLTPAEEQAVQKLCDTLGIELAAGSQEPVQLEHEVVGDEAAAVVPLLPPRVGKKNMENIDPAIRDDARNIKTSIIVTKPEVINLIAFSALKHKPGRFVLGLVADQERLWMATGAI